MLIAGDNGALASGKLAIREERLVTELLRLYREGKSLERVEEALRELRLVRAQRRATPGRRMM